MFADLIEISTRDNTTYLINRTKINYIFKQHDRFVLYICYDSTPNDTPGYEFNSREQLDTAYNLIRTGEVRNTEAPVQPTVDTPIPL